MTIHDAFVNKLCNMTTEEYLVRLEWLATKLFWEMENRLKFIFEQRGPVAQTVNNFFQTGDNFF